MEVLDALQQLEKEDAFKKWRKSHKGSYLAHIFVDEGIWQVGYYNANDSITSFELNDGSIAIHPESEIFKENPAKIRALDKDAVKVTYAEAIAAAQEVVRQTYHEDDILKRIAVLQHLDQGQVFNITFVTKTMSIINVKVDSAKKQIIEHHISSLMDLGKVEKGGKGSA